MSDIAVTLKKKSIICNGIEHYEIRNFEIGMQMITRIAVSNHY